MKKTSILLLATFLIGIANINAQSVATTESLVAIEVLKEVVKEVNNEEANSSEKVVDATIKNNTKSSCCKSKAKCSKTNKSNFNYGKTNNYSGKKSSCSKETSSCCSTMKKISDSEYEVNSSKE